MSLNAYLLPLKVHPFNRLIIFIIVCLLSFNAYSQVQPDELLARQYYQNGEYEKAAVIYKKLFSKNPDTYYNGYFTTLLKLKQYDEAEKVVKGLIKASPENYLAAIDYGKLSSERGQQQQANEWYESLINAMPKDETAIRSLALEFYKAELYEFAEKALLTGRKTLHDDKLFTYDLISLYRYQKNKPLLIQEYLNAINENPQIQMQAQNTFISILDDRADYDLLKSALLKRLQKDPQNIAYTEMLTWQLVQQKEFDMALKQVIALDKRLKQNGERVYDLTWTLLTNKAYVTAVDALQYLINLGKESQYYIAAKIQLLNTKNHLLTEGKFTQAQLLQLESDYNSLLTEFGKNNGTAFAMRQLANLDAYYLNKPREAGKILEEILKLPKLTASVTGQTKLDLGDIYILTGELWEASLIYGQVEKQFANEPMGQEAKFRGARLSYFQGDFTWAKAQLDVLKESTSQLIANDALNLSLLISENSATPNDSSALRMYSQADMNILKNQLKQAILILDSIDQEFPGNSLADDILMAKSKIFIKQADWQLAASQLQLIIDNYSYDLWADDAVFMLADIYENQLANIEKAQQLYQKIITDYPGSMYVSEARRRFRNLRGDKIG